MKFTQTIGKLDLVGCNVCKTVYMEFKTFKNNYHLNFEYYNDK